MVGYGDVETGGGGGVEEGAGERGNGGVGWGDYGGDGVQGGWEGGDGGGEEDGRCKWPGMGNQLVQDIDPDDE